MVLPSPRTALTRETSERQQSDRTRRKLTGPFAVHHPIQTYSGTNTAILGGRVRWPLHGTLLQQTSQVLPTHTCFFRAICKPAANSCPRSLRTPAQGTCPDVGLAPRSGCASAMISRTTARGRGAWMTRTMLLCFDLLLLLLRDWREGRCGPARPQLLYMQCMYIQHNGGLNPLTENDRESQPSRCSLLHGFSGTVCRWP